MLVAILATVQFSVGLLVFGGPILIGAACVLRPDWVIAVSMLNCYDDNFAVVEKWGFWLRIVGMLMIFISVMTCGMLLLPSRCDLPPRSRANREAQRHARPTAINPLAR